ncbi:MAG: endonuclease domain-containing protein [Saprospiraceae bacterium]
MKKGIHYGASGKIFGNAKALRKNMTYAEKLLWSRIRDNKIGYYFRRQHPLSNYIVDFYCHQVNLVIEVDGDVHGDKTVQLEDQNKEESIKSYGLHVLRFTNDEVLKDVDGVVQLIKQKAKWIEENLV